MATPPPMVVWALSQLPTIGRSDLQFCCASWAAGRDEDMSLGGAARLASVGFERAFTGVAGGQKNNRRGLHWGPHRVQLYIGPYMLMPGYAVLYYFTTVGSDARIVPY